MDPPQSVHTQEMLKSFSDSLASKHEIWGPLGEASGTEVIKLKSMQAQTEFLQHVRFEH